ncbi:hypothetical protein HGQ98_04020 [Achromobacter ruhlandii]|uniref:Uncharacterized protein n=1 Tax=Achromobacter ruhlandii TaxID=72557 RepID=A0A848N939_9BURK|nr:hypothetical protein [Achromobacter ruhlandii]NMU89048.1 hypothetical protein [Achromobacter ruhlandii]
MTNQNNAAQAANDNPVSDEYVNAIIQRHGYDSPESVIAQLHQWIGLHGGEDTVTLLMYEAHKALSKLRAPVADERAAFEAAMLKRYQNVERGQGSHGGYLDSRTGLAWRAWNDRAALASAPVTEDDEVQRIRDRGPAYPYTPNTAPPTPLASAPVADEQRLRRMLCVQYAGALAYMDDGEAQDARAMPIIDFLRDSLDEIERKMRLRASAPVAGEAVNADFLASWEAQRHAGNEWADMATNGIQWMRNVRDGISTPEKALECLASDLAHCRATQARAGITPPAAPQASAEPQQYTHAEVFGPMESAWNAALEEAANTLEGISDGHKAESDFNRAYAGAATCIRALKTQADKDGGQQRAVDVDLYGLAIECGAVISTDDLSWTFSYSAMRNFCIRAHAALSAPQAEQGEREDG